MSSQSSFYGTTASGGGHPPTACVGQNLAHLPVSRPAMRSGDAGLIHRNGAAFTYLGEVLGTDSRRFGEKHRR